MDWLVEVIRRFSVAYLQKEPLSSVSMKNPFRTPKVSQNNDVYDVFVLDINALFSGKKMKFDIPTENGLKMKSNFSLMPFWNMVLNCAWSVISWEAELFRRLFGFLLSGKRESLYYWLCAESLFLSSSTHLREENHRILEARRLGKSTASQLLAATASDEEKSIVNVTTDGRTSTCAACRTRQSSAWWKGPKGLSTPVLCNECGMQWRKYGDLSLKTPSESLSGKHRISVIEKREGTPLGGSAPKMKVSTIW